MEKDHHRDKATKKSVAPKSFLHVSGSENVTESEGRRIREFYRDYIGELARTLRRMFGDGPPDPDDIAQDAFQKLIERGDLGSIKNLRAFVWRTARNLLTNAKNRNSMRSRYDYEIEQFYFALNGYGSSTETVIEAKEQIALINDILMTMPKMRRRAFVLNRVEGLSIADVCRRLGMSRPAASKHIIRAMADLESALAECYEGDV